jgi:hypothetical protein
MTLQTNLDFIAGREGLARMRRLVAQLNAEKKGVKFVLVEAPTPFIVCSVEAILAGFRRIPNTEVAETIVQSAMRRLEDVIEEIHLDLDVEGRGVRGGAARGHVGKGADDERLGGPEAQLTRRGNCSCKSAKRPEACAKVQKLRGSPPSSIQPSQRQRLCRDAVPTLPISGGSGWR